MNKMNKFSRMLGVAVSAMFAWLLCNSTAWSDEVPSNSVRIGFYDIFYHATATDITGPYVPTGVNLKVKDVTTLYVAYVRRLTPDWDMELAFGLPPKTETEGKGPATLGSVPYDGQVISSAKWFAPTLLFNYNFLPRDSKFQIYAGAGINYTTFYDRRSTPAGDAASGGPTKISLSKSIGPAATAGLSYKFTPNWGIFTSYSITRVNTHLTTDTAGVIRTSTIKFGPQALVVSVGYSF
jgi:outer membrane protein